MSRYTSLVPIRWSDMDAYGHVNNVQFLTYLEEARIDMFQAIAEEMRNGVLVANSSIRYLRPLVHRHQPVPIDVWVTKVGGASFNLAYEVHDEGGSIVYARARSLMVPYDFSQGRPRRLSPTERVFLDAYLGPDLVVDQPVGARA